MQIANAGIEALIAVYNDTTINQDIRDDAFFQLETLESKIRNFIKDA